MVRSMDEKINPSIRLFKIKLVQRLGLTYLKPRAVTWIYRKDNIDLFSNLKAVTGTTKLYSNC